MDQDAFRATYKEVNERNCLFEKAVLTHQLPCSCAEKFCIAEREAVHCGSEVGHQRCQSWLNLLREQARFALKAREDEGLLPHGKAIKLQVGGIRGLAEILNPKDSDKPDIYDTLKTADERFNGLNALPFDQIMPEIAAFKVKQRARRKRQS